MPSVFMKEVCLEQVDGATTKVVERGLPFDRFTTARPPVLGVVRVATPVAETSCRYRAFSRRTAQAGSRGRPVRVPPPLPRADARHDESEEAMHGLRRPD
jgi:hypothetical protein